MSLDTLTAEHIVAFKAINDDYLKKAEERKKSDSSESAARNKQLADNKKAMELLGFEAKKVGEIAKATASGGEKAFDAFGKKVAGIPGDLGKIAFGFIGVNLALEAGSAVMEEFTDWLAGVPPSLKQIEFAEKIVAEKIFLVSAAIREQTEADRKQHDDRAHFAQLDKEHNDRLREVGAIALRNKAAGDKWIEQEQALRELLAANTINANQFAFAIRQVGNAYEDATGQTAFKKLMEDMDALGKRITKGGADENEQKAKEARAAAKKAFAEDLEFREQMNAERIKEEERRRVLDEQMFQYQEEKRDRAAQVGRYGDYSYLKQGLGDASDGSFGGSGQTAGQASESVLERMLGPIEQFDAYKIGFELVTGAALSAYDALVDGEMSAGKAVKAFVKEAIQGLGKHMLIRSIQETAEGFAMLAVPGGYAQAVIHFKSAALFAGGAAVAGGIASGLSSGGGSGGGGAPMMGNSTSPIGGGGGGQTGTTIIVVPAGDPFARLGPKESRELAEYVLAQGQRGGGGLGVTDG